MSMFGSGSRERIYEELKWIFEEAYEDQWESPDCQLNFTMDVLYVLHSWFGDW